jgi:hypothetical protein
MSGYTMTQMELYYTLIAPVTKNTYTTQAAISSPGANSIPRCLIPALYFTTIGKSLSIYAAGTLANTSGATFILAAGLDVTPGTIAGTGGATLFTSATLTPTASVTQPFEINMDIVCQAVGNAGTTLQMNGNATFGAVASSGSWSAGVQASKFANNLTGINNELALYFELFGTWSASSASNTTTLQMLKVYGEN